MPSSLIDGRQQPADATLSATLGKARGAWSELVEHLAAFSGVTAGWKFYGAKHGWQWKAVQGKRAALYLIPHENSFTAALALRPAALELARARLPAAFLREIETAKPGPEGHPARVLVRTRKEVALVKRLLDVKLSG
jgi:hypothetical protein